MDFEVYTKCFTTSFHLLSLITFTLVTERFLIYICRQEYENKLYFETGMLIRLSDHTYLTRTIAGVGILLLQNCVVIVDFFLRLVILSELFSVRFYQITRAILITVTLASRYRTSKRRSFLMLCTWLFLNFENDQTCHTYISVLLALYCHSASFVHDLISILGTIFVDSEVSIASTFSSTIARYRLKSGFVPVVRIAIFTLLIYEIKRKMRQTNLIDTLWANRMNILVAINSINF